MLILFSRSRCLAQAAVAMAAVILGTTCHAEAKTAAATAASPAVVRPIALTDILVRAEEDQQRLDRVKRLLAAADPVDQLTLSLKEIERPVSAKMADAEGASLRELSVRRLESLARHWQFDARRFERWESQAHHTLAPYADAAMQLAQRRSAWSATRAEGLLDGLPQPLTERVGTMLDRIDGAEADLGTALTRHFDLMQQASELKARIHAGASEVASAIDDTDRQLFQLDASPLWRTGGERANTGDIANSVDRGLQIERQFAMDYNAASSINQHALRFLQIMLLPLILWLARRSSQNSNSTNIQEPSPGAAEPSDTGHARNSLRRPVSVWLLLSLLAVFVFESDAPILVHEVVLLIAIIPALRLLPTGALHAVGVWPYVAVAMFAIDRIGVAVLADQYPYRIFMLSLTGLAIALTGALLKYVARNGGQPSQNFWVRFLIIWGKPILLLLLISAVANILGDVSLAETITSGVIGSGYMALLMYSGAAAASGLVRTVFSQPEIVNQKLIRDKGLEIANASKKLISAAAGMAWLLYSLEQFRILRPLKDIGTVILSWGIDIGEVSIHVADILVFLFSTLVAFWAASGVQRLLRNELPAHAHLPRGVGNSIASLSYYAILFLGLLLALSAAGFKVSQLALILGALGVGVGFGLQNLVNNFVSGLVLMFERPVQPGDVVDIAGSSGIVREIGLRSTTLRTGEGADVVIPNGALLSGNLTNWTMFDRRRRVEVSIGIAYGTDPAKALAVLRAAAAETPGVAETPPPVVLITACSSNELTLSVRVWVDEVAEWAVLRGALIEHLIFAIQSAGISLPSNKLEVNLASRSGDTPEMVSKDRPPQSV